MPDQPDPKLTETAASAAAAGAGAIVSGVLIGASPSLISAQAALAVMEVVTGDVLHRQLSNRERGRVERVAALARDHVEAKLRLGHELRSDGFFSGAARSSELEAEIVEHVLLVAQRQHQERKLPHLARLLGNIPFDADVSPDFANHLLRLFDQLSYRQFCLLKLFLGSPLPEFRRGNYYGWGSEEPLPVELWAVLDEIRDLDTSGVINANLPLAADLRELAPERVTADHSGTKLHALAELWRIEDAETNVLLERLSWETPE